MPKFTIVIPTFNEEANVGELVRQLRAQVNGTSTEVIFVDDSSDGTAAAIAFAASAPGVPVRIVERSAAVGQLAGAVLVGILLAHSPWVIVMDGDLQHPPEGVNLLMQRATSSAADVVIASRYMPGGGTPGLTGPVRRAVSRISTACAKGLFPRRLRRCSDPMTGFFAVRKSALRVDQSTPSGFKILLQLLLTNNLTISEVPLTLGPRVHGESKASLNHGLRLARQLISSRLTPQPYSRRDVLTRAAEAHSESSLIDRLTVLGVPFGADLDEARQHPYALDVSEPRRIDAERLCTAQDAERRSGSCVADVHAKRADHDTERGANVDH